MNAKSLFRALKALLCLGVILALCACAQEKPPDDETPEPPALAGSFSSPALGTLRFTGDGKSIALELTAEGAGTLSLPQGKTEGSYVFLFRNERWRYDKAETFRVILEDGNHNFRNAPDRTNESTLVFYSDSGEALTFQKDTDAP